ncbi:MAG: hypothetical protein HUU46_00815 [Candidatus Hydrogenedentes bacterium]|nr:hypothetical protein [Candidatus Hydrogenedentota bacterium]
MDRRSFLALCSLTGAHFAASSAVPTEPNDEEYMAAFSRMFPPLPRIRSLLAAPLPMSTDWDVVVTLTSFQGLVNRREPRVYFVRDQTDRFWLDYYVDRYGISCTDVDDPHELILRFKDELSGYVLYDTEFLDTANVATVLAGIETLLPVSPEREAKFRDWGFIRKRNLAGRWKNRYQAYRWAHRELWPLCNKQLLGAACVDRPIWPSESVWLRDYLVAHRIFTFDLSASKRDRADRKLLQSFLASAEGPGCVMGWRCARCNEHEFVGLAARYDLAVLSATDVCNLTVHAAIPKRNEPFVQSHRSAADVGDVERKVYVSFMATDGDAMSSMLRLQAGRFNDPEHGQIPFAYGFLPVTCDLMPGVAAYNFERKTDNDYFLAPSSGAMYTYPYMMPHAREYLRATRQYMNRCGQKVAYMINWDDDYWWQEMELPEFLPMLREQLPGCIGFLRGQGESAFERQFFGNGAPYIFSGEGLHRDSDVYTTFRDFIDANPIRPLFIYCLSNHTITMGKTIAGLHTFADDSIRVVRMDEFLHLVRKAVDKGMVPADDFYPDKSKLRELLRQEALPQWPAAIDRIEEHANRASRPAEDFADGLNDPLVRIILNRSATPLPDIVAFTAIWDSMLLTKLALNLRGIYVNHKASAVEDFVRVFAAVEDAKLVRTLWSLWADWDFTRASYHQASAYANRLAVLASRIGKVMAI